MANSASGFWSSMCTKRYEAEFEKKPKEALEEFKAGKVKWYGSICMWGIGNLFFGSGLGAMKKVKESHPSPWKTYVCVLYFLACFIAMGAGGAAAALPENSIMHPVEVAGCGAWMSILCAVGCYHLATYEFHPPPQDTIALSSFAVTSFLVSVFWACTAQDPRFLHVFMKLLALIVFGGMYWIWRLATRMGRWIFMDVPCWIGSLLMRMGKCIAGMLASAGRRVWAFARGARAGYQPLGNR